MTGLDALEVLEAVAKHSEPMVREILQLTRDEIYKALGEYERVNDELADERDQLLLKVRELREAIEARSSWVIGVDLAKGESRSVVTLLPAEEPCEEGETSCDPPERPKGASDADEDESETPSGEPQGAPEDVQAVRRAPASGAPRPRISSDVRARILKLRQSKSKTQREICEEFGVSLATVARIDADARKAHARAIDPTLRVQIIRALGEGIAVSGVAQSLGKDPALVSSVKAAYASEVREVERLVQRGSPGQLREFLGELLGRLKSAAS